jgi:hypothetical protein
MNGILGSAGNFYVSFFQMSDPIYAGKSVRDVLYIVSIKTCEELHVLQVLKSAVVLNVYIL